MASDMLLENSIIDCSGQGTTWFPGRCIFLGIDRKGRVVVMPLLHQSQGPQVLSMVELQDALNDGSLRIERSVSIALRNPADLSKAAREEYDFWEPHFRDAVKGEARHALLEEDVRVALIAKIADASNRPKITVRRMLYMILRAGRHLHGLCKGYERRGAPGSKQKPGTQKRGRKPRPDSIASKHPVSDFRGRIENTVYDRVMEGKEKISAAYRKMLPESFSRTVTAPNGKVKTMIVPESERPTLKQFRTVAEEIKHKGIKKTRISSTSARHGTAKDGVLGPGYRYEIDATGGQLELVSEFDLDQPIGSANAYGLLDVWSTVCVGGAMGAFHASYKAAQVALFNTFTSKKELCARWDIDIEEEAWPCHHVSRYITSDRGELVSDASEALPTEFNTIVQTAAPYDPQMKGTIEGWFSMLKSGDIRKLVGFGRKMGRMQRDPKHDAALTRYDAMRAFLMLAINYNQQAAPKSAIPPQMIEQGYETISRITLWQWGLRNLIPCARIEEPGYIYTSLLRKVDASIRENGLFVGKIRYMSLELRASGLLQRAAEYGSIAVQATVDDFLGNTVWYRVNMDAAWQPAYLADEKLRIYNATFAELVEYHCKVQRVHERSKIEAATFDLETESRLREISDDAVDRKNEQSSKPKRRRPKDVRVARTADAQNERREHGAAVMQSFVKSNPTEKRNITETTRMTEPQATLSKHRLDLVKSAFLKLGD
jgi:putative transposase